MATVADSLPWLTSSVGDNIGVVSENPAKLQEYIANLSKTLGVPAENLFLNQPTIFGDSDSFNESFWPDLEYQGVYSQKHLKEIGQDTNLVGVDVGNSRHYDTTIGHETGHLYDNLFGGPPIEKKKVVIPQPDASGIMDYDEFSRSEAEVEKYNTKLDEFDFYRKPVDKWLTSPELYQQGLDSSITGYGYFGGETPWAAGTDTLHANYEFNAMRDSWDRWARTRPQPSTAFGYGSNPEAIGRIAHFEKSNAKRKALTERFMNNPGNIARFGSDPAKFRELAEATAISLSDPAYENTIKTYDNTPSFTEHGRQKISHRQYMNSPSERWARYIARTLNPAAGIYDFMPQAGSRRERQRDAIGYYLNRESENER
jgi:hypothetical protein